MSNVGKVNLYRCPICGGETVTIDLDEGVTPFMLACRATEGCRGMAQSSLYRPRSGHGPAMWEWYKPTAKQLQRASPGMRSHGEMGGLFIRARGGPS